MRFWSSPLGPIAALGLTLAACGGGSAGPDPATAADAPSYTVSSSDEWQTLLASGESSFESACGACHPGGEADLGPAIKGIGWDTGAMYVQIREGSGRMKPIPESRLPESEMKGLFVYLSSMDAVSDIPQP